MTPSVHYNISHEEYHTGKCAEYISSSMIRRFLKAPALFGQVVKPTAAMDFGSAYHSYVLDGDEIPEIYKTAKAQAKAEAQITAMAEVIRVHKVARAMIEKGRHEVTFLWDESGMPCKCRADIWIEGLNLCADLKTTGSAAPEGFRRSCQRYGYDIQAAWYMRGISKALGLDELPGFVFVAQEKDEPYLVGLYEFSPDAIYNAMASINEALAGIEACRESGVWPGYADEVVTIY